MVSSLDSAGQFASGALGSGIPRAAEENRFLKEEVIDEEEDRR